MYLGRHRRRMAGVAALAVAAVLAVGCSSSGAPPSSGGGAPVKGGTAKVALPAGVTLSWIFPFYAITNASVYNSEQFQWLMYRPLYWFGGPTNVQPDDRLRTVGRRPAAVLGRTARASRSS